MQITPAELGKFKAIIHHFEKLQDSFEVLSVILAEDDPRLGNLSRLKKHVAFFSEKFERDEAEKFAKKKREEDQRQLDIVRLGLALQTFFPKAFPIEAEKVIPLTIGIDRHILDFFNAGVYHVPDLEVTPAIVAGALHDWTRTAPYYYSFKKHRHRYDLYGDPVEIILQRDFNHANKKYVELTGGQQTAARKTIDELPVVTEDELARTILNSIINPTY
ncbi:hypothetical protein P10VF_062 [Rhizobium phage vB_RleM_P10VF]|uniref:ProQ/FinO domain-containing protein n=1 Tax=Rhizobium phage vB_RleM_P10VF TaxID=1527770 RepID=A0A076YLS1_9CAUD|nr:hypothetical protein P10VF_062 [Rhizobium phage vB_RleM_P10VF]AIK68275.1 hypothetical protein P10VF_062 [Rhizobium phage vB_RleM_P10VF]